jgi:hypothetical protein
MLGYLVVGQQWGIVGSALIAIHEKRHARNLDRAWGVRRMPLTTALSQEPRRSRAIVVSGTG